MHGINPFTNKYQLSGQNYVVLCQLLKSQMHHLMFYSHDINYLSVMLFKISDAEKNMVLLLLYYDTRECCNEEVCLVFSDPEFCHRVGMQDIHFFQVTEHYYLETQFLLISITIETEI